MIKGQSYKKKEKLELENVPSSLSSRCSSAHAHTYAFVSDSCGKVLAAENFVPSRRAITGRRAAGSTLSSIMERMGHIRRGLWHYWYHFLVVPSLVSRAETAGVESWGEQREDGWQSGRVAGVWPDTHTHTHRKWRRDITLQAHAGMASKKQK